MVPFGPTTAHGRPPPLPSCAAPPPRRPPVDGDGGFRCWECAFVGQTVGGLSSHAACKHGAAPHAPGGDRAAWKAKCAWAAAEAAVALAIALNFYNNHSTIDVDRASELKG